MFNRLRFKIKNPGMFSVVMLLFLSCALWQMGTVNLDGAQASFGHVVQLRLESRPINAKQVESLISNGDFEGEPLQYTAWFQRDKVFVEQDKLAYSISVEKVLFYSGHNGGIFQVIKENACAISKEVAVSLFGSEQDALGQALRIDGDVYHVERILAEESVGIVARVSSHEAPEFQVLDIRGFSEGDGAEFLEKDVPELATIIFREGLHSDLTIWYEDVFRWLRNPFSLPDRFVPAKWSEFEFWGQATKAFSADLSRYFSMKRFAPDQEFLYQVTFGFGCRLLGVAIFVIWSVLILRALRKATGERGKKFGIDYIKQACQTVYKRCGCGK